MVSTGDGMAAARSGACCQLARSGSLLLPCCRYADAVGAQARQLDPVCLVSVSRLLPVRAPDPAGHDLSEAAGHSGPGLQVRRLCHAAHDHASYAIPEPGPKSQVHICQAWCGRRWSSSGWRCSQHCMGQRHHGSARATQRDAVLHVRPSSGALYTLAIVCKAACLASLA